MTNQTMYSAKCSKCGKENPHILYFSSRKRGVRLISLCCEAISTKFYKFNKLVEFDFEKLQEEAQKELDSQNKQLKQEENG